MRRPDQAITGGGEGQALDRITTTPFRAVVEERDDGSSAVLRVVG
ncbi:hypothetical protein Q5530_13715 [Saccharothrix sp. BKS2]